MATTAPEPSDVRPTGRFIRTLATIMAITIVCGFALQFARGLSTLSARPLVHAHGLAFMGWVGLFLAQAWLATRGSRALHRRLGWLGAFWVVLLVVLGTALTVDVVQRGTAPFFFQPQHFLIANPLTVLVFAALVCAAIRRRKQTDWHMRLQICAMVAIIGPAFGRLLPMPLFMPFAFEAAVLGGFLFLAAGLAYDRRVLGRVHPAWWRGAVAILAILPLAQLIAHSAVGDALYGWVTAGHPGAAVPAMAFPPMPPMP